MKVYYRRTGQPYAYPLTRTADLEVSILPHGSDDEDWACTEVTIEEDGSAHLYDLGTDLKEGGMLADSVMVELAIRERLGLGMPVPADWTPFTPEYLDDSGEEAHEALCDAVELLYGHDMGQRQRVTLRSRLSEEYADSHNL